MDTKCDLWCKNLRSRIVSDPKCRSMKYAAGSLLARRIAGRDPERRKGGDREIKPAKCKDVVYRSGREMSQRHLLRQDKRPAQHSPSLHQATTQ